MNTYELNDYAFDHISDYNKASSELSAITYINSQLKNQSIEKQYELYCSVVSQRSFTTVIGLKYLADFRNKLQTSPELQNVYIPPVYILHTQLNEKKVKRFIPIIFSIALTAVITCICTVLLLNNSKNLNVINYRRILNAEYSSKMERLNNMIDEAETKNAE